MASMSRAKRARRYLQASMEAGYTGLPNEVREAKHSLMRAHERAYPGVRTHALAGADQDFDEALSAGEREHQRHLRREEGITHADVLRMRRELRASPTPHGSRAPATRSAARRVASGAGGAISAGAGTLGLGGGGNILLQLLGVGLLLSLAYLLLAGKGVTALAGIAGTVTAGARAFIAPEDPLKRLQVALGANPASEIGAGIQSGTPSSSNVPTVGTTGYVNPFSGDKVTPERIDQGQDFALTPGSPIRAIGPGKVTSILSDWYKGQPLVAYELTAGPAQGRTVYVAEEIAPTVKVGQRLAAGQVIGTYAKSGTGIETGWGLPSGRTLAQATSGYTEGAVTAAGKSFSSFLQSLGVPV